MFLRKAFALVLVVLSVLSFGLMGNTNTAKADTGGTIIVPLVTHYREGKLYIARSKFDAVSFATSTRLRPATVTSANLLALPVGGKLHVRVPGTSGVTVLTILRLSTTSPDCRGIYDIVETAAFLCVQNNGSLRIFR